MTTEYSRKIIALPPNRKAHWRESLPKSLQDFEKGSIDLHCGEWHLGCRELKQLTDLIERKGLKIESIKSRVPETVVTASALGHQAFLDTSNRPPENVSTEDQNNQLNGSKVLFHEGTLRSGDHLNTAGDVLVLGDVNPGAKISAGGDVMVWGCLRGIAHAGQWGDKNAKIISLRLKPLQLRIADAIARGPDEDPTPGLAEEAILEDGKILIRPTKSGSLNKINTYIS